MIGKFTETSGGTTVVEEWLGRLCSVFGSYKDPIGVGAAGKGSRGSIPRRHAL